MIILQARIVKMAALTLMSGTILSVMPSFSVFATEFATTDSETSEDVSAKEPQILFRGLAAPYLKARFAQNNDDWNNASVDLKYVLNVDPDNTELQQRHMFLAMGAGQYDLAASLAHQMVKDGNNIAQARLFVIADAFRTENYQSALELLQAESEAGSFDFLMPVLTSWAQAGSGHYDIEILNQNALHKVHAAAIAGFLGKHEALTEWVETNTENAQMRLHNLERVADLLVRQDMSERAAEIYKKILSIRPDDSRTLEKINALNTQTLDNIYWGADITSAKDGAAVAIHDMAELLVRNYPQHNDDIAQMFTHLALMLKPDLVDAKLTLAVIHQRNENFQAAIKVYDNVPETDPRFLEAQRQSAALKAEAGSLSAAVTKLEQLAQMHNDIDSRIQIGDILRREEQFDQALIHYNKAFDYFGNDVPRSHWNLLYVRGISHEQLGNWSAAEKDLKAALAYQPNNPYIMNYLGYSWADQGIRLDESLELIRRAVALEPEDGYITDSLGWVLYRMGQYNEAVKYLEKAVALLPYDPVINDHLGDAYWKVGRRIEARFQWQRAKNHSDDESLHLAIVDKLDNGLNVQKMPEIKAAENNIDDKTLPDSNE